MFQRTIAALLILSLALPLPVQAGMLATESALQRDRIAAQLERAEVRAQLEALGVSPGEVRARVAALTDAEAADLARRIEELPAGGMDILGVALIVFLVLLVTDILGYTKVFPFTRSVK